MTLREITATGAEAIRLATALLQRARRAHRFAGLWEAADVQWWSAVPRASDDAERVFWLDGQGPVAGVLLTAWSSEWQCDPIVIPGASGVAAEYIWQRALAHARTQTDTNLQVPVRDDDTEFIELARASGLEAVHHDDTAWMDAADRTPIPSMPDGFALVDRTQRQDAPHPLAKRNGDNVAERLADCSLYDPSLDIAVETAQGETAAYSLYWFDRTTHVGLVEPVRVEDDFQRRGLARAMLTRGIDRLVARGAQRIKVAYETEAAGALYRSVGFRPESGTTWFENRQPTADPGGTGP